MFQSLNWIKQLSVCPSKLHVINLVFFFVFLQKGWEYVLAWVEFCVVDIWVFVCKHYRSFRGVLFMCVRGCFVVSLTTWEEVALISLYQLSLTGLCIICSPIIRALPWIASSLGLQFGEYWTWIFGGKSEKLICRFHLKTAKLFWLSLSRYKFCTFGRKCNVNILFTMWMFR